MNKIKGTIPLFLVVVLTNFILVFSWFKDGNFLATGETGLSFYNPTNQLLRILHAWGTSFIGMSNNLGISDLPFYYLLSLLQILNIPPNIIQGFVFFILMNMMFFSFYLLMGKFFSDKRIIFISSLLYVFNLFALVEVWGRFQYTFMFYYAYTPLGLYFFIRGLKEKKYVYALVLAITSTLFSGLFASIPHFILFWGVIFIYLAYYCFDRKNLFFNFKFLFLSAVFFILFQSFWLLPFLQNLFSSSYTTNIAYSSSGNYQTFSILSQEVGDMAYLLRMMYRNFFLDKAYTWGSIYFNPFFIFLTYLVPFLALGSVLVKKQIKQIRFFLIIAIIALFFSKGSNPPFGFVFDFLFTHVRLLEAFRNPAEKIGFLLPFSFAPLVGVSLISLYDYLKSKIRFKKSLLLVSVISIILIIVLPFPIWNGWIFSKPIYSGYPNISKEVKVPEYYKKANDWLVENNAKDFRTITFPLGGEGMTYNWDYGYSGVELSNTIFSQPFISINTSLPYSADMVTGIEYSLIDSPSDFWKIANLLNTDRILLRKDINYQIEGLRNPKYFVDLFSRGINNLNFEKNFGPISFYKLKQGQPRVFAANSIVAINGGTFMDFIPLADYDKSTIFVDTSSLNPNLQKTVKQIMVKGKKIDRDNLLVNKENARTFLESSLMSPDSKLYFLSQAKISLEEAVAYSDSKLSLMVIDSGKKVLEINTVLISGNYQHYDQIIKDYDKYLSYLNTNRQLFNDSQLKILLAEKFALEDCLGSMEGTYRDKLSSRYIKLVTLLNDIGLVSAFDKGKGDTYTFNIPQDGYYHLNIPKKYFTNQTILFAGTVFSINGKVESINFNESGNFFISESKFFKNGKHELNLIIPQDYYVVLENNDEHKISTIGNKNILEFDLNDFDPNFDYEVTFDYLLEKGNNFKLKFYENTDHFEKNERISYSSEKISNSNYNHGWIPYKKIINPNKRAEQGSLAFELYPYNECLDQKLGGFSVRSCKEEGYRNIFNLESVLHIKNLKIKKIPNFNIFLASNINNFKKDAVPTVNYVKFNPSKYKVNIKEAKKPYLLVFSDSYNNSWELKGSDSKSLSANHFLTNNFANAWIIDKPGDYSIDIIYTPEDLFNISKVISLISIVFFSSLFICLYVIKKIWQ